MHLEDKITLVKQDGTRYENVPAQVDPRMIFIDDAELPVEEGDRLERVLSNGLIERYVVLDRGFYSAGGGFPAHYQAKVRKETAIDPGRPPSQVYNVHGPNARINVNSQDQSTNVSFAGNTSVFAAAQGAIAGASMPDADRQEILTRLRDLEAAAGTQTFVERYQQFITAAANHMTVLAPFLPAITQLLHR